ncbi:hypothetical protein BGZ46_005627 [Entomortierella lignicola]|nr:hypothetical protein BGZ46_005627 [Entomortierella lignicola]
MDLSHAELQHKQQKQQQQSTLLSLEVPQDQFEALSIHSQTKPQTQAQPIPISTHQHHSDPRHLMPPLQIQVTDYSPQSQSTHKSSSNHALASSWPNGSTSSLEKSASNNNTNHHNHQSDSSPPTSTTLSSASGHLAVPEKNRSGSRRWSLTGIFFGDRRKSALEQSHIPNGPNNKNGQTPSNGEGQSTSPGNSSSGLSNIIRTRSRSSSNGSSTGKPTSSGRSSLSDISRSFISSMRRVSSVDPPPSSNTGNHDAMIAATAAVSASIAAAMGNSPKHASVPCYSSGGEDMEDDMGSESVYGSIQRGWIGENRYVAMATQKGPPLDPLTLSKRPPLKSILKKQSVNNGDATIVAPTPSIAGGSSTTSSILESDSVHPMAPTSDEDSPNSKPFVLPTEHRAKLVTNSPPPTPQVGPTSPPADYRPGHSNSSSSSSGSSNGSNSIKPTSQGSYKSQKRDSTPSDNKPGVQSNYRQRSRGDDISQAEMLNDEMMTVGARAQELGRQYHSYSGNGGGSRSLGSNTSSRQRSRGDEISQAEMLNDEMMSVGARAQDLERQYYGYSGNGGGSQGVNTNNNNGDNNASGMPSPKRRAIGFMDRIEIIPAHRKADYNRQSDKNVTFRVLTPELRGDIRDELNHYKLHEMAVHVDSMHNTAFH